MLSMTRVPELPATGYVKTKLIMLLAALKPVLDWLETMLLPLFFHAVTA